MSYIYARVQPARQARDKRSPYGLPSHPIKKQQHNHFIATCGSITSAYVRAPVLPLPAMIMLN
ncbi:MULTISPECIES: hypothetical protein [unclassified Beijerinckia]|uniref:hypothetical protein n=1 Tax=unclassified Beijerinckia TaxID=2638183 RepID=UPI0008942D8A|nr:MULTISPECIES: hypothetical protein [unclassified Beijerinckia]MDH7794793.1 hypothetical protein [Beijerinckia sp. GAS462]SEB75447.1 hypothetical protein SAMN05443249_1068 [Beijerinckia sp. 28-YEA-48]